jgi:hypothetical protein
MPIAEIQPFNVAGYDSIGTGMACHNINSHADALRREIPLIK